MAGVSVGTCQGQACAALCAFAFLVATAPPGLGPVPKTLIGVNLVLLWAGPWEDSVPVG